MKLIMPVICFRCLRTIRPGTAKSILIGLCITCVEEAGKEALEQLAGKMAEVRSEVNGITQDIMNRGRPAKN